MPKISLSSQRSCLLFVFWFSILYAHFLSWGLPLWDDDFGWWLNPIADKSIWDLILEILSPLSAQSQNWAFNERPLQRLIYKISYLVSERESWSYFFIKSLFFAGMACFFYLWCERLQGARGRSYLSLITTLFFLFTPGVAASFVLLQDFAPVAEFFVLAGSYFFWGFIESKAQSKPTASKTRSFLKLYPPQCLLKGLALCFFYLLRHKE